MKHSKHKIIALIIITGFLLLITGMAMAIIGTGDGNLLKRSEEETCHACHKTDRNARTDANSLKTHSAEWLGTCSNTNYTNRTDCLANGGTWTSKWGASGWGIPNGKYGEFVCTTCHTPHDTKNIYLLKEAVTAPNSPTDSFPGSTIDFRAFSGNPGDPGLMGDDTGGHITSTRVCEVCHSQNKYHNYNTANNTGGLDHNNAADCTACHSHLGAFRASCDACHGNPPTQNTLGGPNGLANNPSTGSTTAGAHNLHVNTKGFGCNLCHYNSVGTGTTHRNTNISLGFVNLFGLYTGGSYDGQTTANYESTHAGTTVSKTGTKTCSSLYCHGGTMAPNGGTATAVWDNPTSGACGTCHGADAVNPPTRLSHPKHAGSTGLSLACTVCHSGYTSSHVNGSLNWAFDTTTYSWLSGALYRGASSGSINPVPSATYGQCSNLYCHSTVQADGGSGAPVYGTPTWGGASPGCAGCHPDMTITGTGSHLKHTASFACSACHNNAGPNTPLHANHNIDVLINPTYGTSAVYSQMSNNPPQNGYGNCTTVTCHNDGTAIWSGGTGTGNTPVWGTAAGCNACHGNTTYTNYRKAAPLYASGTPKPNAHVYHVDVTDTSNDGSTGTGTQCKHCHNSTTTNNISVNTPPHLNDAYTIAAGSTYLDGDNVGGAPVTVTVSYSFTANTISTCSNVSCHPTGLAGTKAASATKWSNTYSCTDCHNINMNNTTAYHHVMDATAMANRTYPTSAPTSSATDPNRKCTMCHVDHDIFSPKINASSPGRSYNLRTAIGTTPTATAGYTNSDYVSGGGICISCHTNQLTKNTTNQKSDGTTVTMAVTDAQYSVSAHQYNVSSTMANGGATFNANCVKCHNSKNNEPTTFQGSTNKFGAHGNPLRRLLASLGMTSPTDPEEEDYCYRCHSKTTDTNPGGGPAKTTSGKDYYNAVAMSASSEGIFSIMGATTTVSTTTLYFRDFSPSEPMPNANILNSGTYTDNTYRIKAMDNTQGSSAQIYTANTTNGSGVRYFRVAQFLSPPVATSFTWNAGTSLTLTMRNVENNVNNNCNLTWAMYKWNANDTLGTQFENVTNGNEFPTTVTNTNYTITTDTAVTFNPGDKILIEIEIRANSPTNTGTCTVYWNGATENSRLSWTGNQSFSVPLKPSKHNVAAYSGIHRPTVTDETKTYLSTNKHVECNDCHNPHEAKAGTNSGTQTNLASGALMGAPAVNPTWGGFWSTSAGFTEGKISSTGTYIYEYQICFRCHSSYNTNISNWNANWTTIDQEFNPSNVGNYAGSWASGETAGSFHPVAAAATNNLGRTQNIISPWATTSVMMCSDCHASDTTTDPKGPHGSAASFILKGPNTLWNASLTSIANNAWMPTGTFCLNCHNNNASSGRFSGHSRSNHAVRCFNCHSAIPHGGPRPGFLIANAGADTAVGGQITSWDTNSKYYQGQTTNRLYLKTYPANNTTGWAKSNCGCNGTGH